MSGAGALSAVLRKKLRSDAAKYLRALSGIDRTELATYQGGSWINDVLRRNRPLNVGEKYYTDRLDRILREAPQLPEDLRVYRGATPGVYPGPERGYLSTTLDRNIARDWPIMDVNGRGQLYSIDVNEGTPFVMPLNIVPEYHNQDELIFPRGAQLLHEPSTGALNYLRGKYARGGRVL